MRSFADIVKEDGTQKRKDRIPVSLYFVYLGVLLLMSGLHTGLVVWMEHYGMPTFVQILVPVFYWSLVAIGLTVYTRKKIRETYEDPLQKLADATEKVAKGDFSIYLPTINTADKYDYLDEMILDFNKMVEELGSIETLKTDFVSNVSHEMKTPIAVIKNYSQLLEMDNLTEEQRLEFARTIDSASDRLTSLITNILKLNKLENQSITPDMESYDACEQIVDSILQFETRLDEKEIELDTNLDERRMIHADKELMSLVWNNLLSNAIKFSPEQGEISVMQKTSDGKLYVSVTDHGCGMDAATKARIFDKFYQGDTSHATEGNGLGLALAVRVLELMDGKLTVESQVGVGSTFTVEMPLVEK